MTSHYHGIQNAIQADALLMQKSFIVPGRIGEFSIASIVEPVIGGPYRKDIAGWP
jgi:hypothetical protein